MKFYTDHYFHIGYSHINSGKPCQDYATSGIYNNGEMAYAIISDGCSTGGNTDIGSRVVSISTASILKDYWLLNKNISFNLNLAEINLRQKLMISNARVNLDLKTNDMFATCNYISLSRNGGFVHTQGDGVVFVKYLNNNLKVIRYDWQNNMPFYPIYSEFDLENFIIAHGNNLNKEVLKRIDDNYNYPEQSVNLTLQQGITGPIFPIYNIDEVDFIAVFSDGITQIENCDWKNEVLNFTAFKSLNGEFLKRRMINAIKETKKKGNGPLDDVSCAVIRIDHNEE